MDPPHIGKITCERLRIDPFASQNLLDEIGDPDGRHRAEQCASALGQKQTSHFDGASLCQPSLIPRSKAVLLMTRRARSPSEPELTRRDEEDLHTCNELIDLLASLESAGLLRDMPLAPLSVWLRRRVSFDCAARREDLTDPE